MSGCRRREFNSIRRTNASSEVFPFIFVLLMFLRTRRGNKTTALLNFEHSFLIQRKMKMTSIPEIIL